LIIPFRLLFTNDIINAKGVPKNTKNILQAISKKGFWFKIAVEMKFKPEAYSNIPL
jgi:hypothetical protein